MKLKEFAIAVGISLMLVYVLFSGIYILSTVAEEDDDWSWCDTLDYVVCYNNRIYVVENITSNQFELSVYNLSNMSGTYLVDFQNDDEGLWLELPEDGKFNFKDIVFPVYIQAENLKEGTYPIYMGGFDEEWKATYHMNGE